MPSSSGGPTERARLSLAGAWRASESAIRERIAVVEFSDGRKLPIQFADNGSGNGRGYGPPQ
jgi:hypothetical protein